MPNFSCDNVGTWFHFDPANETLGGVCLKTITPEELRRIEQMTVRHRKKIKRGIAYDDPEVNEKLADELRWDFCIVGWKEISIGGQPAECTKENKLKLMNGSEDFRKFIGSSLETLNETNRTLEEARAKNLEISSNGSVE